MDLDLGLQPREFGLLLTVRVPGDSSWGFDTVKLILWGWCFGLLLLGLGFSLSLKWTYENGCIIIRRIKVSFLSVQTCFLRWTRHQWPDIITPFLLSPVHSKLNVFFSAHKPVIWSLNELKWSPESHGVCRLALQPYRVACRLLCSQCIVLKVWPLTNWKPL